MVVGGWVGVVGAEDSLTGRIGSGRQVTKGI